MRLVLDHQRSVRQVAEDLGINRSNLNRWIRLHRQHVEAGPAAPDDQVELRRLRKELARVKLERDILKKAVGIFSKAGP